MPASKPPPHSPMTPHDTFDVCLDAFAREVGASLPERAEGDAVVLSIDGLEVEFREDADGQAVVLAAEVGEMPPDAGGVFAALALRANFASLGATALSLDAETGGLFATASLPLALADPDALSRAVEGFVDAAEEWSRYATAFLDVDDEAALARADDEDASPLSGVPDFIRV